MKKKVLVLSFILSIMMVFSSFAGWVKLPDGDFWAYQYADGKIAKNEWVKDDFDNDGNYEWFYFNEIGIMLSNAITPDGYKVDNLGQWLNSDGTVYKEPINNGVINTLGTEVSSSTSKKKELQNAITEKNGYEFFATKRVGSKTWVNVMKLNGTNSFVKAYTENCNFLSFEASVSKYFEDCEYSLVVYADNEEIESFDDFSSSQEIEIVVPQKSEIMLIYNIDMSKHYLSDEERSLYIRNAKFKYDKDLKDEED